MGQVFKEGVDSIYDPMADFAIIPPPLYEQLDGKPVATTPDSPEKEILSAKYQDYDDRPVLQEAGD